MNLTYKKSRLIDGLENQVIFRADGACIPFVDGNTDYANFKKEILADEAQLQDADGKTMTAEQAKDYVRSLP